jgi:hypothetical protein
MDRACRSANHVKHRTGRCRLLGSTAASTRARTWTSSIALRQEPRADNGVTQRSNATSRRRCVVRCATDATRRATARAHPACSGLAY